jgi:diguanylate cyclase (GGDEF)-like protein
MIKEKEQSLDELYGDLISKFMRVDRYIMYGMLCVEVLFMIIYLATDVITMGITKYIMLYIVRPFLACAIIYRSGSFVLRYSDNINLTDTTKVSVPLIILLGILGVLIRVHYVFPTLYGTIIIPLCLSTAFGNKQVEKRIYILSYIVITIALMLTYTDKYSVRPQKFMFDALITYVEIFFTDIYVRYIISFEKRKDVLVHKYHARSSALSKEASTDPLTGLLNIKAFTRIMTAWMDDVARNDFAFCIIDIDNFKRVNDTYGHNFGNIVLKRLAQLLIDASSDNIIVARYGGEEFCFLISGDDKYVMKEIVDKVRREFKNQEYRETPDRFTFSGGLAVWDKKCRLDELIMLADANLYTAKGDGKDKIVV